MVSLLIWQQLVNKIDFMNNYRNIKDKIKKGTFKETAEEKEERQNTYDLKMDKFDEEINDNLSRLEEEENLIKEEIIEVTEEEIIEFGKH